MCKVFEKYQSFENLFKLYNVFVFFLKNKYTYSSSLRVWKNVTPSSHIEVKKNLTINVLVSAIEDTCSHYVC